ncbi:MAG: internal scaffolding protein [Microviridae sp.]|nr:MAG: internal scaffolding protein [Microviridae sp.]
MATKKEPSGEVQFTAPSRAAVIPRNPYTKHQAKPVDFGLSRTKQAFTKECDINLIISRYQQTGQIHHLNTRLAQFADVENIDFQEAQNTVIKANEMFAELPAKIRAKFHHNPGEFLEFALNPDNVPEMAAIGLIDPADIDVLRGVENAPTGKIEPPVETPLPAAALSSSSGG